MIIHDSLRSLLDAEGLVIMPKELTPAIACALENCAPPEAQTSDALEQLVKDYNDIWSAVIAAGAK